jgi:hypothetical protein
VINLKYSAVLVGLLAGACAAPAPEAPPIAFWDPAIPVYNAHCSNGTTTGHGEGFQNCISQGLTRESIARAGGGHDEVYSAAMGGGPTYTATLR